MKENAPYVALTDSVFSWLERAGHEGVTSTITMTELLVQSYREEDERKVDAYYGLLSTYPNLRWVPPELETADLAARLRATHRLQTPDAIQAATALREHVDAILTNDPIFTRVGLETAILDQYL